MSMVKTPSIPKESPEAKSKELCNTKGFDDAVKHVRQIMNLAEGLPELQNHYHYWKSVMKCLDPSGTFSRKSV